MSNFVRARPGYSHAVGASANSRALNVTSGASAKGSWTELVASTKHDVLGIHYFLGGWTDYTADTLTDIAVGAAGSEVVVVSNIQCYVRVDASDVTNTVFIPIAIKRGERIAVRTRASLQNQTRHAAILQYSGGWLRDTYSAATTYGITESTCLGVQIDPSNIANQYGPIYEITGSTTSDIQSLIVTVAGPRSSITSCHWGIDILVGGSGSETVVVKELSLSVNTQTYLATPAWFVAHAFIPKGSRITARARCSINGPTARLIFCSIIGFQ